MTAWNLFSYETRVPITVTKFMLIQARSKWVWPKFSTHYACNYKLQTHYTKIPRSAPAVITHSVTVGTDLSWSVITCSSSVVKTVRASDCEMLSESRCARTSVEVTEPTYV